MLDLKKAAPFLVVAWVKDWTMRTLFNVVAESEREMSDELVREVADTLPFMPSHIHWYVANNGSGVSARHFVADAFPKLSSALWSAKDNAARLKLAEQIERLRAGDVRTSSRLSREDKAEMALARKEAYQTGESRRLSREAFKTNQRSAWNVCKA